MLGPPSSAALAGLESTVVALLFLWLGRAAAGWAGDRLRLDAADRWGLAFPAFAAGTVVLMLAHMATGGRVLSNPWLTRALVAAAACALAARWAVRRAGARPGPPAATIDRWMVPSLLLAGLLVWGSPVFRMLPLNHIGDTPWHAGLAAQIMNGQSTPSATVTGAIPNFYPWLFHAMLALLAWWTPGERSLDALGPLQLLQVWGLLLSLYALGRRLTGRWVTGAALALLGGLSGGFGWVLLRHVDLVVNPRSNGLRYLGDLLYVRSYHVAFTNLAPPFPRDVTLNLLVGFLLLLVVGLRRRHVPTLVAAGAVIGMAGLAGAESFFVGAGVAVLAGLFPIGMRRGHALAALLVPAAAVALVWYLPLGISYLRLGGFVNITIVGPVNLTALAVVVSWGLATPLGAYGFIRFAARGRRDEGIRVALLLLVVTGGILVLSVFVKSGLGSAFLSLSRRHRYWPLLEFAIAVFAALGAGDLVDRLARWRVWAATLAAAAVAVVSIPSPVVASVAEPVKLPRSPLLTAAVEGSPSALLNRIAPRPGMACIAAVPENLDFPVFAYTGYRLVLFRWGGYTTNLARIRWRDIYRHVPGDRARLAANAVLTTGAGGPAAFRALVRRYRVNVIVAPRADAGAGAFAPYPKETAAGNGGARYTVVWVNRRCGTG